MDVRPPPAPCTALPLLERLLEGSFGIFSGSAAAWAVLRGSPEASRWLADEAGHPEQLGQWQGTRFELQVPPSDPRELLRDIRKFGPAVEVLAPADLRAIVAERLHAGAAL